MLSSISNVERAAGIVILALIGLAAMLFVDPPAVWAIGAIVVLVTCIGSDHVAHRHWRMHLRRKRYAATIWILPALVVAAAGLFLRLLVSWSQANAVLAAVIGLGVTGVFLTAVIVGQYRTIDPTDRWYRPARFTLNLLAYLTAFALYSAIYQTKLRSSVSATAIVILTGLLCLDLFRDTEARIGRTFLYSAIVALIIGEITWVLNYWTIAPLVGGVFLLLCLYLLSGFVQNYLMGQLQRSTIIEFGAVTLLGFALLSQALFPR